MRSSSSHASILVNGLHTVRGVWVLLLWLDNSGLFAPERPLSAKVNVAGAYCTCLLKTIKMVQIRDNYGTESSRLYRSY